MRKIALSFSVISILLFYTNAVALDIKKPRPTMDEEMLVLGQDIKAIEKRYGKAKFIKGVTSSGEKVFTRGEWFKSAKALCSEGQYLFRFRRYSNEAEYAVLCKPDMSESEFYPTDRALRVYITFKNPPAINELSLLVPEITVFDKRDTKVFMQTESYQGETTLVYILKPSDYANFIAGGFAKKEEGYGFAIEIVLETKTLAPNVSSKVKELRIDVARFNNPGYGRYQPFNFLKLSK